jgi:hypothetical protein
MDYGCAVIWRRASGKSAMPHRDLLGSCNYRDWDTYFANRKELLNLLPTSAALHLLRKRPLTRIIPAYLTLKQSTRSTADRLKQKVVIAHHALHDRSRRYRKVLRITKRVTRQVLRLPPA